MRRRGRSGAGLSPERTRWLKDEIRAISARLGPSASARRIYDELLTQHGQFCKETWLADFDGQLKFIRENRGEPSRSQVEKRARIARANAAREHVGEERAIDRVSEAALPTLNELTARRYQDRDRALGPAIAFSAIPLDSGRAIASIIAEDPGKPVYSGEGFRVYLRWPGPVAEIAGPRARSEEAQHAATHSVLLSRAGFPPPYDGSGIPPEIRESSRNL